MNNISLSFELICLMSWLLKNEKQAVNALIKQAVKHGFTENLELMGEQENGLMSEQLYTTVLDFLIFLENSLIKQLDDAVTSNSDQKELLPTLKKIDAHFDSRTLLASIRQAKSRLAKYNKKLQDENKKETQQVLFESMLTNWKPNEEDLVN